MSHSIGIVIPYFGPWPEWINFFVESCRVNPKVDWLIVGDQAPPENSARNVRHLRTTFADYKALISDELGIEFDPSDAYKMCDVRPALPLVHREPLAKYDFVGFGDLDVIYGDLRSFYDDEILSSYDLLSTHPKRVSGHLCLFRNTEEMVCAFKKTPRWKAILQKPQNVGFDETGLFQLFRGRRARLAPWRRPNQPRCFFREAYSTPGPTDRMRWYWKNGQLTNEYYPHHPFMYLHFMSWHSNRWYSDQPNVSASDPAPWTLLPRIVQMDWRDARSQGFMISPAGIQHISERAT